MVGTTLKAVLAVQCADLALQAAVDIVVLTAYGDGGQAGCLLEVRVDLVMVIIGISNGSIGLHVGEMWLLPQKYRRIYDTSVEVGDEYKKAHQ
jgi:hypothetical protein